jgi:nucleotide-binding universal stress UspA family protein
MGPIVVGTDGSPGATLALERAGALAGEGNGTVHLVTAVHVPTLREPIASSARTERIDLGGVADSVLARGRRLLEESGVKVETHSRAGDAAEAIIDVAQEVDADLIVVGARGLTGLQRFLLGSVSAKVSHYADRTVMVVRDPAQERRR